MKRLALFLWLVLLYVVDAKSMESVPHEHDGRYDLCAWIMWTCDIPIIKTIEKRGIFSSFKTVCFNHDGTVLISSEEGERALNLWDGLSGNSLGDLLCNGIVNHVACSPSDNVVAVVLSGGAINFYDLDTQSYLNEFKIKESVVTALVFSPDGKKIALCAHTPTAYFFVFPCFGGAQLASKNYPRIRFLDIEDGNNYRVQSISEHDSSPNCLQFSPDGSVLVSGSDDGYVQLWDVVRGSELITQCFPSRIRAVSYNKSGLVALGAQDCIYLFNIRTGTISNLSGAEHRNGDIYALVFSPCDMMLISGSCNGLVKLWDVNSGKCLKTIKLEQPIKGFSLSQKNILAVFGDSIVLVDVGLFFEICNRIRKIPEDEIEAVKEEYNVVCSICDYDMLDFTKAQKLLCGHIFHSICLNNWRARIPTCPICRAAC